MSHETVEVRQDQINPFEGMSVQEIWLYASLAQCNNVEQRAIQYYLEGMPNLKMAREFNSHVDFVVMTLAAVDAKLREQKKKVNDAKSDQLLYETVSGPTFLPPATTTLHRNVTERVGQKQLARSLKKASVQVIQTFQLPFSETSDWQENARCNPNNREESMHPDVFYPDDKDNKALKAAKEICGRCVVDKECLQAALDQDERFGVWGGLSQSERQRLKIEQRKQSSSSILK